MDAISLKQHLKEKPAPCIWMQAEVVRRKNCFSNYNCHVCRYDRALRRVCDENTRRIRGKPLEGKRGQIGFWKNRLNKRPPWKRPCLHHMKGRIDFKACNREYKCEDCEFDQYFDDQYTVHALVKPVDFIDIDGIKIPHGFYLHKGHTWVKVEEGSDVRIGLDDFILRTLGPLDRIETPLMGKALEQNVDDIIVNRGTDNARVLSPISGVVTAVNTDVRNHGRIANQDPYGGGWILRAHSENLRKDLLTLMIGSETTDFYKQEIDRLYQVIEDEGGVSAADGGQLGTDIYGSIPRVGWNRLVELFLRPKR
jgi:glycine cleavage system H lipoate-binding protein